jgi:hypothetical protein
MDASHLRSAEGGHKKLEATSFLSRKASGKSALICHACQLKIRACCGTVTASENSL